jgi:hypothetical protein
MGQKDETRTTGTSTSGPIGPILPMLEWGSGQGLDLAKAGTGFQPFTGTRYAPINSQMHSGLSGIEGVANSEPIGWNTLRNRWRSLSDDPTLRDIASGKIGISQPGMGLDNPAFRRTVDDAARGATEDVMSIFGGSGRGGSGMHQATTFRESGNLRDRMLAGQMNIDQQRKMEIEAANIANRFGGSQAMGDRLGQLLGFSQTMRGMEYEPYEKLLGVGETLRNLSKEELAAKEAEWREMQGSQLAPVEWLTSLMTGMPRSTVTTTQVPQGSALSGFLGGGLQGGSVGSQLGLGGWGTALGAGVGGLAGLGLWG